MWTTTCARSTRWLGSGVFGTTGCLSLSLAEGRKDRRSIGPRRRNDRRSIGPRRRNDRRRIGLLRRRNDRRSIGPRRRKKGSKEDRPSQKERSKEDRPSQKERSKEDRPPSPLESESPSAPRARARARARFRPVARGGGRGGPHRRQAREGGSQEEWHSGVMWGLASGAPRPLPAAAGK